MTPEHFKGFWYMASPYRKYPGGLELAAKHAAEIAAELLDRNVLVYSPIVHSHHIADFVRSRTHYDDFWLQAEIPFMRASRGMILIKMPSWDISSGIAWEQDWFKHQGRPIYRLSDPLPEQLPGALL
jgi:hypothetical protein